MTEVNTQKPKSQNEGLICRGCGCRHFFTIYTRPKTDGILRRKRCRNCGKAAVTFEKIL